MDQLGQMLFPEATNPFDRNSTSCLFVRRQPESDAFIPWRPVVNMTFLNFMNIGPCSGPEFFELAPDVALSARRVNPVHCRGNQVLGTT